MRDVASGRYMYVGKEAPNLPLEEELEKSDSEGRNRAKLAGSCLMAAVYFIVYLPYSLFMHPRTEIDMAVLEASL